MKNMLLKVNKHNGASTIERVSGTLNEIAERYFSQSEVETVEVLDGGIIRETKESVIFVTDFYRVSEEEAKEFDLYFNIRCRRKTLYKSQNCKEVVDSHGIAHV